MKTQQNTNLHSKALGILLVACLFFLFGCAGGGTSGTGGRLYEGLLLRAKVHQFFGQVNVTLDSTGETTSTDANGAFTLHSSMRNPDGVLYLHQRQTRLHHHS